MYNLPVNTRVKVVKINFELYFVLPENAHKYIHQQGKVIAHFYGNMHLIQFDDKKLARVGFSKEELEEI